MMIFLAAFDDIPDPRADNARYNLCELLVAGFVAVLCRATSCAGMADFGRAKEHVFRDFLKLKHSIPSHDLLQGVSDDRSQGAGCGLWSGSGADRAAARRR
ncbi:MAG: transposase family protein [Candidatus Saccharibacteria bacterium]|nr:transposase family protein [Pseudorhodobacter sp.]